MEPYWDIRILVSEDDRRERFGRGCTGWHWIEPYGRDGWAVVGIDLVQWDPAEEHIADMRRRVAALIADKRPFEYLRLGCDGRTVARHILCGRPGARLEPADFDY